MIRTLT